MTILGIIACGPVPSGCGGGEPHRVGNRPSIISSSIKIYDRHIMSGPVECEAGGAERKPLAAVTLLVNCLCICSACMGNGICHRLRIVSALVPPGIYGIGPCRGFPCCIVTASVVGSTPVVAIIGLAAVCGFVPIIARS